MTLRARPVTRGSGRSGWNSGDRRTTLLNVGFVIAISISVLILVGYAAWSWYDDHFGAAATVDSTTITKDQLRSRAQIESFRITYTENRIRTLANMGIISAATLARFRKYAFLIAFVLGAIITPTPDVFNMTMMSIPIYLLYEIGILGARIFGKKRGSESTDLTET